MLLEVVIAVGLLVMGMAFVGMQMQNASQLEIESERNLRGLLLAESKMAELDTGLIPLDEEIEEDFGPLFPDYGWRMRIEPTAVPDLNLVTLAILRKVRADINEEFDFDAAEVVHTLYTMRATPTRLDLTRDFGLEETKADDLTEQLAGVGDGGLDPRNLDPSVFKNLDIEQLLEVAPALLDAFGMSMNEIKRLLPPELLQALEEAQADLEESRGEDTGDGGEKPDGGGSQGGTVPSGPGGVKGGQEAGPAPVTPAPAEGQNPPRRGNRPRPTKGNRGNQNPGSAQPS